MAVHELAGTKVRPEDYIDLDAMTRAYHSIHPDAADPHQQVRFGTSGHRGQAQSGSFTADHVAAITQAVCNFRQEFGADGPLFVGADTHYLSKLAFETVLSVLAANKVTAYVDADGDFVPTPSVSRAILRFNDHRKEHVADGLILTPSHNPPEHGGIKYNPTTGGPAGSEMTKAIETEANRLLAGHNKDVQMIPYEEAAQSDFVVPYDYKGLYVAELASILDMEAIRDANLPILVNALGGSGMNYWHRISERYHLNLSFVNDTYDPQFTFMNYDHDGKVRMDCSSAYVMSAVTGQAADYRLILANDPDYDRFGIVCGTDGMITANAFLTVAAHYLMTHRHFEGLGIAKLSSRRICWPGRLRSSAYRFMKSPSALSISGPFMKKGKSLSPAKKVPAPPSSLKTAASGRPIRTASSSACWLRKSTPLRENRRWLTMRNSVLN